MQETGTALHQHHRSKLLLCLLGSLLWHLAMIPVVIFLLPHPSPKDKAKKQGGSKLILVTAKVNKKPKTEGEEQSPPEEANRPFAKTDADRPQQHPDKADFEGQRDSRAEGMNLPQEADKPIPTMEGEEKEEINTLHQERQDGDIAFYGKEETAAQPVESSTAPQTNNNSAPTGVPLPPTPPETQLTDNTHKTAHDGTEAHTPAPPTAEVYIKLQQSTEEVPEQEPKETPPTLPAGVPAPSVSTSQDEEQPVYDPTQAAHAQPAGLRTRERRTRSRGQFIIGSRPSLQVEATPLGQYEELVYRLIARQWYFACDQHRGDIIPGTIIIALRINSRGQVVNMNLVSRRGAGVSQQSFTFGAIRRAQFPRMPENVRKAIIGDQLELIITFDFN